LGDQIRSIDKSRLKSRMGTLRRDELLEVEDAVRITLELSPQQDRHGSPRRNRLVWSRPDRPPQPARRRPVSLTPRRTVRGS
jgi:hypothetical protein